MSGFSLIELMIAMGVSLFLLAGMIAIVLTLRNSFGIQDAQSRVQESQRFALTVLDNTVRAAGYYTNPTTTTANNALPVASTANPDGTIFAMAQGISGTSGTASDTLNIRFQTASGDGLMDCLGDTNTSGSAVAWSNSFAVNAANQLTCAVSINGGTPGAASILADNVSSMKVLYGVDTTGVGSTNIYLSASAVTAGGYWPVVQAVQMQISFVDLVNSTATTTKILPVLVHMINLMNKP